LKTKASAGLMETEEIVQSYHDINEIMSSKKLFDDLNSGERRLLKHRMDLVKDELRSEIEKYGKANPEFYKTWTQANEAYGAIASSKKVSNWLESKIGSLPKHLAGSIAIDIFLGHPLTAVGAFGTYGLIKTGELIAKISKSPKLREHYMKVLFEAGNENLPGVVKHLEVLNTAAKAIQK
jgi:hypothetical protein